MNQKKLYSYYLKYKKVILPVLFCLLSVFVVFAVIVPQISSAEHLISQLSDQNKTVEELKNSFDAISGQNDSDLDTKLGIATDALPITKDITKIFNSLNDAASASNTSLQEFSLSVGGVYEKAPKIESLPAAPSLEVLATVVGSSVHDLTNFAREVSKKFPLAEISSLSESGNSASYKISFFYKPINLSIIAKQDAVFPLSVADASFLTKLSASSKD